MKPSAKPSCTPRIPTATTAVTAAGTAKPMFSAIGPLDGLSQRAIAIREPIKKTPRAGPSQLLPIGAPTTSVIWVIAADADTTVKAQKSSSGGRWRNGPGMKCATPTAKAEPTTDATAELLAAQMSSPPRECSSCEWRTKATAKPSEVSTLTTAAIEATPALSPIVSSENRLAAISQKIAADAPPRAPAAETEMTLLRGSCATTTWKVSVLQRRGCCIVLNWLQVW